MLGASACMQGACAAVLEGLALRPVCLCVCVCVCVQPPPTCCTPSLLTPFDARPLCQAEESEGEGEGGDPEVWLQWLLDQGIGMRKPLGQVRSAPPVLAARCAPCAVRDAALPTARCTSGVACCAPPPPVLAVR